MIYWIAYFFLKALGVLFFPLIVHGKENLPLKGSFFLASNHISYLDPIVIGLALERKINYVAKEELFKSRLLGFLLYKVGAFPIKRNASDVGAIREILKRVKRYPIVIFPEGTRAKVEGKKNIFGGVGFVAVKSGVSVIPVFVQGTERVLSSKARFIQRGRVAVSFGKPLRFFTTTSYDDIARQIMTSIERLKSPPIGN